MTEKQNKQKPLTSSTSFNDENRKYLKEIKTNMSSLIEEVKYLKELEGTRRPYIVIKMEYEKLANCKSYFFQT